MNQPNYHCSIIADVNPKKKPFVKLIMFQNGGRLTLKVAPKTFTIFLSTVRRYVCDV